MDKNNVDKLTKEILQNCDIYPKPHPDEIKEEIYKIDILLKSTNTESPPKNTFINRMAKKFDINQRVKQNGSWIKYSKK